MLKIAITGNIASGKSQVEKFISEKYTVYDADNIAHQILGNVDRKSLVKKFFQTLLQERNLKSLFTRRLKMKF